MSLMEKINTELIGLLPSDIDQYLDLFKVAFIVVAKDTLLPELYELFSDKMMDFINVFGGRTFVVPDKSIIEKAMRMVEIYKAMNKNPDNARHTGERYGMSEN